MISLHRLVTSRAVASCLAASTLAGIALAWGHGTGTVSAATSGGVVAQQGGSCPLTPAQQLKSIKTFLKMMPVFRHPRCLNCHGALPDPTKGGLHAGVAEVGPNDACDDCHMDNWGSGSAPNWSDKTDMSLCRGMHVEFEGNAPAFIDHIVRDGGGTQFIEAAFAGKRGVNEGGQTIYEEETKRTFKAEPPPGTHAQLIQLAKDWVAAQGGKFVGDRDCGCIVDRLKVDFKSTLAIANQGPAKEAATITGQGSAVLKLGPDLSEPDWDVTTGPQGATSNITWSGVTVTRSNGCVTNILSSPATSFEFWLAMSYRPEPKISLQVVPGTDMHASVTRCPHPITGALVGGRKNDSTGAVFMAAWSALHGHGGSGAPAGIPPIKPGETPKAPPGALDLTKLQGMDPAALQKMAEGMQNNPTPEGMAQIADLMHQVVPGADQMLADAQNNFKFALPDQKWCTMTPEGPTLARCAVSREVTLPDNKGSTQKIKETTTITVGRPAP